MSEKSCKDTIISDNELEELKIQYRCIESRFSEVLAELIIELDKMCCESILEKDSKEGIITLAKTDFEQNAKEEL